jgi:hypothetical protein
MEGLIAGYSADPQAAITRITGDLHAVLRGYALTEAGQAQPGAVLQVIALATAAFLRELCQSSKPACVGSASPIRPATSFRAAPSRSPSRAGARGGRAFR